MAELLDVPTETKEWVNPTTGEIGEGAPEKIKNVLGAKKWTNVEQIVDGYTELEKFTGTGKHLLIPDTEDAEGWEKVFNVLRPESPDKYVIEDDELVPIEPELADKWKQYAHKMGLTQKQMAGSVDFQRDIIKGIMKTEAELKAAADEEASKVAAAKEETVQAMMKKAGGEVAYKDMLVQARRTADDLGIYKTLEAKGLASDPDIITMLNNIVSRTAEGVIKPSPPPPPAKTAEAELAEIQKSEAFIKPFDPKHKETMTRYQELCNIIAHTPGYKPRGR